MRRFVVLVALGSALVVGMGTAFAAVPARSPSLSRSYKVVLKSSGDEYEDANNQPINGTDGTKCPPSREVPSVKAKCWTWSAKGLGHGTFTQANPTFEPGNFTATFTYTDTHGNKLTGTNYSPGVQPDPTPPHTVGHVNRFPGSTDTFTGGTGKFRGVPRLPGERRCDGDCAWRSGRRTGRRRAGHLDFDRADVASRSLRACDAALIGGDPGGAVGLTGRGCDRVDQGATRLR